MTLLSSESMIPYGTDRPTVRRNQVSNAFCRIVGGLHNMDYGRDAVFV